MTAKAEAQCLREALERIDKFIKAVAPSKLTKELYSIQQEVRAVLDGRK